MIVIIVVVSIVAVALFGVFTTTVARSADPMLRMQAVAIAQGYLEEAMLKAFTDPDQVETGTCEAAETRPGYDDVLDYNCVSDVGARDQFGNPMPELAAYDVTVTVNPAALLGMHEIIVTVDHGGQTLITLSGHRANY
jgi:MSHA pilin protein MshD